MAQGLRQGCVVSPLLLSVFSAATHAVERERFSKDADIYSEMVLKFTWRAFSGMFYADDACIVSRPPRGFEWIIVAFVDVFGSFGRTISESKTETMCTPIPSPPAIQIVVNATGQQTAIARQSPSPFWMAPSLKPQTCRMRSTSGSVQGG